MDPHVMQALRNVAIVVVTTLAVFFYWWAGRRI